jgi:hypothetical protein
MQTSFVKTVPQGDFVEISVLMNDWQDRLQSLLTGRHPIKMDIYPFPEELIEFHKQLDQHSYRDLAPKHDPWQQFLIPTAS